MTKIKKIALSFYMCGKKSKKLTFKEKETIRKKWLNIMSQLYINYVAMI